MLITSYDATTFRRKSTVTAAKSVIMNKRLYDLGSFELTLKDCDFEVGDIVLYGDFSGRINRIVRDLSGNTKVYGYDLKSLLYRRIFDAELTFTKKTPEHILKNIADTFLLTGSRKITGLSVAPDSGAGEVIAEHKFERGSRVSDELKEFCQKYSMGYDITFDEQAIIFDVVKERENKNIIFGKHYGSVEDLNYTKGDYNMVNVIYYPKDASIAVDGVEVGINRFEGYVSNADEVETYGESHSAEETIKGTASNRYVYGTDYALGDIVRVEFGDMYTMKTITEVEITVEPNCRKTVPTFGTEKENPIKKLIRG